MIRTFFFLAASIPLAGSAQCRDEALSEAAAELLLAGASDAQTIEAALRAAGSDLPHARMMRGARDHVAEWIADQNGDAPMVCGEASGATEVVVLASARGGALEPDDTGFYVTLADDFSDAHVALRDAEGRLLRVPVRNRRVEMPDDMTPPIRVQLVATGPAGPRPVAVRDIGGELPDTEFSGEGGLRQQLATLRVAHDVSALRDNALLEREANRHARNVCRAGRARHVLEPQRDPEARLSDRGIIARVVGEVVARARNESAAFTAIARSPSHRMALVDRRFTDVGIGTARRRGQRCVVVTLAAWPRAVGR